MHGLALFTSVFMLTTLAEIPDKTALTILILSLRYRALAVFAGVAAAFFVQGLIAVVFGKFLRLLPSMWVHLGTGLIFIIMGVVIWMRAQPQEEETKIESASGAWRTAMVSFGLIFMAEFGDLTQISTAAFVAKTNRPVLVFIAATLALWSVGAAIIWIARRSQRKLNVTLVNKLAAVAFVLIGLFFLASLG